MKESSTYQAILEEGRTEGRVEGQLQGALAEARKLLRVFGGSRFGPADARTAAAIDRIDDLASLEDLCERLPNARDWEDLFAQPAPAKRRGRRRPSP